MHSSRLALFALAMFAVPLAAHAEDPAKSYTTYEQTQAVGDPSLNYRYVRPTAVGGVAERIPNSALAPIPPNILHYRHDYALGEASITDSCRGDCDDAKGRATFDRHWRHHHRRVAWTRVRYN